MNDYDNENDEFDDYSSSNSFRARSNTWPLNRPDLAAPSSNACIDETLPEIELEEDDLFTTNENWTAGFVDHDIMSWDPILNAQNQHQQQQQQQQQQQGQHQQETANQPTIIHYPPQSQQQQQQQVTNNSHSQHNSAISQAHQRPQSIHLQQSQQQLANQQHLAQQHCHQHLQQPSSSSSSSTSSNQRSQQAHNAYISEGGNSESTSDEQRIRERKEMLISHQEAPASLQQQPQQPSPDPSNICDQGLQPLHHHQAPLDNTNRLPDYDDSNEFHLQQLHHLRLDGPSDPHPDHHQRHHYQTIVDTNNCGIAHTSQMSSLCLSSDMNNSSGNEYCIISPATEHNHQQQNTQQQHEQQSSHLQSLMSARYDYEHQQQHHQQQQPTHLHHHHHQSQQSNYDVELDQEDNLNNHHHQHQHIEQQHNHNLQQAAPLEHQYNTSHQLHHETVQLSHPHHQHQHPHHHHHRQPHHLHQQQYHDLTSSNLDNDNCGSHILSSSLSTSGIGLSADLEDLDYKQVNLNAIPTNYDETLLQLQQYQQPELQQVNSSSSEKLKSTAKGSSSPQASGANSKQPTEASSSGKSKVNAPRRNAWGNLSYADLISQAIESTSDKRLTLAQIYDWMVQHVPYFKDKGDSNSSAGWKNSVRHNLSLHSRFRRLQNEGTGKSSWWTINPEANIGKCARRRAASMEASKYEKKRGRAKKRAEAIRQGLISYPSLTNSSLNSSTNTLGEQHSQAQSSSLFHNQRATVAAATAPPKATAAISTSQPPERLHHHLKHNLQVSGQPSGQQQPQQQDQNTNMPLVQVHTLDHYSIDHPSQQQQQHLQELQRADQQQQQSKSQQPQEQQQHIQRDSQQVSSVAQYEESDDHNATTILQQQQQQSQPQSQQYYYQQFELSTAL